MDPDLAIKFEKLRIMEALIIVGQLVVVDRPTLVDRKEICKTNKSHLCLGVSKCRMSLYVTTKFR